MVKLIALDIDGTVLHKGKIHQHNLEMIARAKDEGIRICLASGRGPHGLSKIAKKFGLWDGESIMVGYNGGIVFRFKHDGKIEIVDQKMISPSKSWKIYQRVIELNLRTFGYSEIKRYGITVKKYGFFEFFMKYRTKRKLIRIKDEAKMMCINKFIIYGNSDTLLSLRKELEADGYSVFAWSYVQKSNMNIEVNPGGINKAVGLAKVVEQYKLDAKDVAFFGDGENDIEALKWAGYGVAMGNAKEIVKQVANAVTEHVDKAGVGKEISRILENRS